MTTPLRPDYVPRPLRDTREASFSRLKSKAECPQKFFNAYLRPYPNGGEGWLPRWKSEALGIGGAFARGIEAYRHSGWKDGHFELDAGLDSIDVAVGKDSDKFHSEEVAMEVRGSARELLRRYDDWHGPKGYFPIHLEMPILADPDGKPYIERSFDVDLGEWVFQVIPDCIVLNRGLPCTLDDKTSAASWASRRITSIKTDAQFTGQILALKDHPDFQEIHIHGALIQVHVKNPGKQRADSPVLRGLTTRTPEQLDVFRNQVRFEVNEILESIQKFDHYIEQGSTDSEAGYFLFPKRGEFNGQCDAYKGCDYLGLCASPGMEMNQAMGFRPRLVEEAEPNED